MTEEIQIARQWLAKALNDLLNADNNLRSEDIPYDTVCFHCQQAAEKCLKACLVSVGEPPPITHDLLLLLEKILPSNRAVESLRDQLALLMPYAVEIRYPDDWFMPSEEDSREAREAVLEWLRKVRPVLFSAEEQESQ